MTANELAAKAAADSTARTKRFDDEALLAAEAFAYGLGGKYLEAKTHDINRRINEQYGTTGESASSFQLATL